MAIFKCKMCGGNLETTEGSSVGICEYCGTKQTVPTAKDENLHGLYNRANTLRIKAEFDKAEQLYEKILQTDESQAEAYWGLILCKYGIEYVEDPKTGKRIPTCHRTSYEAITSNADYIAAIENSDSEQKTIYETEAKTIDEIQKNILNIARNEKPFDVFICYKETDENGKRTIDSTIANDIYYQLTQEGFKVFYAPITLEDKLGQEYEPYIFAALNSAKVMLVVGTKPEYFNAVWVKNEWSRYLKLLKKDHNKMIIPCYRDMDAYDLPDEFAHLQAQDMSKIGFIQDLLRGIKKIISPITPQANSNNVTEGVTHNNAKTIDNKVVSVKHKKSHFNFIKVFPILNFVICILIWVAPIFADGPLYILGLHTDMMWETIYEIFYVFYEYNSNDIFIIIAMLIVGLIVLATIILTFIGNNSVKKNKSDILPVKIQFIIYLALFVYNFFTKVTPYGVELCGYINFSNYNFFGYLIFLFFIVIYVTTFAISKNNNEKN